MSSEAGFGINTDILETNLVNIVLLIGLLIFAFADSVKTSLKTRQEKISDNLDNAANRLILANFRYKDAVESLEKIRTKAIELQREKISELRQTKEANFSQFQPYILDEVKALKALVLGQYRSFDRQLINKLFRSYQQHESKSYQNLLSKTTRQARW
jgi:F-type H+-transporting ATPase subunit b|uniref:ATP synthase CF0 subunit I n=1 Tax=Eustigmatophyceae sp. WTwin 8/9 T-6m6.8 TaxID=2974615 RepID=UPI0021825141|nr:ATP synthase CF0 subunit I [Eustigmatophyceae sp. WTwin 8/9 T-6m6.8]UVI60990.1 ATP synthase CF0 subunit I [Eustigmatophyceae sp. WTwin 8/9 T-6m6.8]